MSLFEGIPRVAGGYRCAVADPPWAFRDRGSRATPTYRTYRTAELAQLPVPELLAADALLLLWCPDTHLPDALWLVDWWGLTYKHLAVWGKVGLPVNLRDSAACAWLGGIVDGEGCISLKKHAAGTGNGQGYIRRSDSFCPNLEIVNTSKPLIERCRDLAGCGSIFFQPETIRQDIYRLNIVGDECRDVLRAIAPYLVAKPQQARILLGAPSSGSEAQAAFDALKDLHHGRATSVDYPGVSLAPRIQIGMGHYLRKSHEVALVAARGHPEILDHSVPSLILAPRGRHSEKPEGLQDAAERLSPSPYLELFARRRRPNWTVWGDELP